MEDVRPVLDFLEEHKGAVAVLQQMLSQQGGNAAASTSPEGLNEKDRAGQKDEKPEREKTQSPLQGIANDDILNSIKSYLAAQAK
ncbi:MAG: hypothetical protein IJY26_04220 [Clostridia bacterium]|nr:hypothetical protein [Clostridia bacterium]